jgi:D-glycero-D-manno-heptose 1,7-bisphosphate phosphatase
VVAGAGGRPAVLLDRDGTVIRDRHHLADPDGVELLPGAGSAIARLNRAGLPVLLVTNQSGIGRGLFREEDFQAVQERVEQLLRAAGGRLDGVYHCPHAPDAQPPCECRKPRQGLFLRAAAEHGVDLGRSFLVGDRARDVTPALSWGATGFLLAPEGIRGGEPVPPGIRRVGSLAAAVDRILRGARD